ncbi:MAG TPA: hypothetical protein VFW42_06505 [Fluviicoccus sp.]|nr:hypothetical protein [Fluviicoccus sp.]
MLATILWFLVQWAVVGALALFPLSWLLQAASGREPASPVAHASHAAIRAMPFQNS